MMICACGRLPAGLFTLPRDLLLQSIRTGYDNKVASLSFPKACVGFAGLRLYRLTTTLLLT